MKGMVFTQLLEMADSMLGPDKVEEVVAAANLPSGGAYTAVGNYPHEEAVALVMGFSKASGVPPAELLQRFGEHLLKFFAARYPSFFPAGGDAFSFLEGVETYIHVEVLKLYPDAELPRFITAREEPDLLRFDYYSSRHMESLAAGLIRGTLRHFGECADIEQAEAVGEKGPCVRFMIRRHRKG